MKTDLSRRDFLQLGASMSLLLALARRPPVPGRPGSRSPSTSNRTVASAIALRTQSRVVIEVTSLRRMLAHRIGFSTSIAVTT